MPEQYRVNTDGTTVQTKIGERINRSTGETVDFCKSVVYAEGDVISSNDISPGQLEQLNAGEGNISKFLELVEEEEKSAPKVKAKKTVAKKETVVPEEKKEEE